MAKLTKPQFEITPEGIVDLCPDLPEYHRNMLIDTLEWAWDDCNTFEAEIEVPMREEPYAYFLRITVDPFDEQVAIERSFS
ncbi:MAG: hypothetical protein HXN12_00305 [Porphyromonadaceae bacterium]|nr:hypothetical protein [Porphyromonadaceae bacterium]